MMRPFVKVGVIFLLEHSTVACDMMWGLDTLEIKTESEVVTLKIGTEIKESEELEELEVELERDLEREWDREQDLEWERE